MITFCALKSGHKSGLWELRRNKPKIINQAFKTVSTIKIQIRIQTKLKVKGI